ncbi:MAG: phosphate ABC transporter permease [Candidatus Kerfeldbacteria bacterium RIFCSPHIGHO2_02_FULL_42_14]|uniref:Transport permease protein n=1 Tax=Candidatus Kerfeldbacteria bacterium RIFCSPHIGHO2_02_FULL_42_14 TaxID=1798540 RepID=A0A1G2AR34_9BACT|nr:MAG: phosphate ABC transporter permease [Candidatus Kerfeldbacteria bacterium RIFCSPHIGHO2_02_FULL_42_14]OGY81448.1 MAG: phosphate ABC transporter permease [Candidatus Kerfeldbacteria bacterium RIFCSPHIGHO2_12_FULL_42_13]OGY83495.1 MAG: phosphate ABC transporter permease [Candidatus Kerfeldbacteria bacterium RIFCSPLOWO2_02_FULL_42_19]OGY86979.1 MAG: phosphate ABC transporter permease [Candidatus Kerfeldbacteria bacterium RIFCSPLOWO2_12_FULL_43_9]
MGSESIKYEITPPKGLIRFNLPEIWRFKDLFYILVWRDIKVRYKQTVLGILWALFQPFLTMVIFTIFFSVFAKVPSDNAPYPIFVYSGLLFWNYYSTALTNASNSLINNEGIVQKVYFPRLILPISTVLTPIADFIFAFFILLGLMVYYHFTPGILGLLLVPLLLLISIFSALGLGLLLSAVNTKYRDVRYILPFFMQILLFITPVIYPVSIIPEQFRWLAFFNPMTGVITLARNVIIGVGEVNFGHIGVSVFVSVVLLFIGLAYFRKTERFFADVL